MIILNLLPYEKKKESEMMGSQQLVSFLGMAILFFFFITIILVAVNLFLSRQVGGSSFKTTATLANDIQGRIERLNKKTSLLSKAQNQFIFYNDSLRDFVGFVPAGIRVDELTLDKASGEIKIKGTAATRDSLLQFRKNLEESERFSGVQLPIENILAKENVKFQMAAKAGFSKLD